MSIFDDLPGEGLMVEVSDNDGTPSVDFVFRHPEMHMLTGCIFSDDGQDAHELAAHLRPVFQSWVDMLEDALDGFSSTEEA